MNLKRKMRLMFALPTLALLAVTTANSTTGTEENASGAEEHASGASATAIFAGGCFWCVESDFDHVPGVLETISGYSGGETSQPTYKNHHQGRHREVVQITYNPEQVDYETLVGIFWRSIDPTDGGGQFCDRGHSYTTAIYTADQSQHDVAMATIEKLRDDEALKDPIATVIEPVADFWPAEDYHQDYYLKNPLRYKYYRAACGREKRVKRVWGGEAYAGIKKS